MADLGPGNERAGLTQAPDVFENEVVTPEIYDEELDKLFEDDDEPDVEDDDALALIQDSIEHTTPSLADDADNGLPNTGDELKTQADAQNLESDHDMNIDETGFADFDQTTTDVQRQDQHGEEVYARELDNNIENIQHENLSVSARGFSEAYEDEDLAPQVHIPAHGNLDDDSLFMPEGRVPFPSSGLFSRPSLTPGPFNRPSATPSPFDRLTTAPGITARPSSRMASASVSASRPAAKSGKFYERIRAMQQKVGKNRTAASKPPQRTQATPNRSTYLDELLSHAPGRENASEMPATVVDEHDKADREAREKYRKQKKHYEEMRKRNGKLGFAEEIQWMKIHAAEDTRLRKRKRDQDMARQANGESDLLPDSLGDDGQYEDMVDDDDPAGSSRIPEPCSRRVFPSMMEAELQSMQVALQANKDKPSKRKRGPRGPDEEPETRGGRGRGKGSKSKTSSVASGKAKTGVRMTAKEKKSAQDATRLHRSLVYSNVFRQQAGENAPEQPTFSSRNKADALKELIASVPTEHQKSAKDDTQALLRATKQFDGRGSCKADGNGMWKVKGMATSLKHYQVMGTSFMRRRENDLHEPRGGLMADQMGLGKTVMSKSATTHRAFGEDFTDESC